MKKCVPVLLFGVLSASVASHADSNVFQQKAEKTKNGIVADVNARQKMFIDRNLNPQKIKKTPKKRMFIQHCLRAMSAPPSIKWILSIDTVYH